MSEFSDTAADADRERAMQERAEDRRGVPRRITEMKPVIDPGVPPPLGGEALRALQLLDERIANAQRDLESADGECARRVAECDRAIERRDAAAERFRRCNEGLAFLRRLHSTLTGGD